VRLSALFLTAAAALAACQKSTTVTAEGGNRLTLVRPEAVTIERGGLAKADVALKRWGVPGELTLRFDRLPVGVDVVDEDQRVPGEHVTYTFTAARNAALVKDQLAEVTVRGPEGIAATESFEVTVVEAR
jgi:hypothetical protein